MISNVIEKVIADVWPMLVVFIVALVLIRFFYIRNNKQKFILHKECMYLMAIIYCCLLFQLLTITEINNNSSVNIIPFEEILRFEFGSEMFIYNVLGNMLIYLPFGYLITHYTKAKNIWSVAAITAILSTVVELVQLNIGRSFDIDDILLNVIGSCLGYLLYRILKLIQKNLPDFFSSYTFYNILWGVVIIVIIISALGYWGVIF